MDGLFTPILLLPQPDHIELSEEYQVSVKIITDVSLLYNGPIKIKYVESCEELQIQTEEPTEGTAAEINNNDSAQAEADQKDYQQYYSISNSSVQNNVSCNSIQYAPTINIQNIHVHSYNLRDRSKRISINSFGALAEGDDDVYYEITNAEQVASLTRDEALKQLILTNLQTKNKGRKTITFHGNKVLKSTERNRLGPSNENYSALEVDWLLAPEIPYNSDSTIEESVYFPSEVKFACSMCDDTFDSKKSLRGHFIDVHNALANYSERANPDNNKQFVCTKCGKKLKTSTQFIKHCSGHNNPTLECSVCNNIYASKASLKQHIKIHNRELPCQYCIIKFCYKRELTAHIKSVHRPAKSYSCHLCTLKFNKKRELTEHVSHDHGNDVIEETEGNVNSNNELGEQYAAVEEYEEQTEPNASSAYEIDVETDSLCAENFDLLQYMADNNEFENDLDRNMEYKPADTEVVSTAVLLLNQTIKNDMYHKRKNGAGRKNVKKEKVEKVCTVCNKTFDRMGDLKRHLIEHIVKGSQKTCQVNKNGIAFFSCAICRVSYFDKIEKYKSHLREHVNLTLYRCSYCNKTFGDSSNFSKHKKVHGCPRFKCDLCSRRFNSSKMMETHMEYHKNNEPINCKFCGRLFHFESTLKKHIKFVHNTKSNNTAQYTCNICNYGFRSLKAKWDHQWMAHGIRKNVIDCTECDSKFRKFIELKRHYKEVHGIKIAKKNLKSSMYKNSIICG